MKNRLCKKVLAQEDIIALLQQNIDGEQEAIDLYEKTLPKIVNYNDVRNRITEILNDEKQHLKELSELKDKYAKE